MWQMDSYSQESDRASLKARSFRQWFSTGLVADGDQGRDGSGWRDGLCSGPVMLSPVACVRPGEVRAALSGVGMTRLSSTRRDGKGCSTFSEAEHIESCFMSL